MGHQLKAMGGSIAEGGGLAQGAGGVQTGGGGASGRLKPDVKVTIAGDRPPRLSGDVVTFEDMREFILLTWSMSSRCMSPTKIEETGFSRGGKSW